ncbi:GNAT family N-acetyltransferase [Cohnella nanjingensis]|uniref:GNAT family N-acetyltransferase n=2 Tax=Cohnella nanjingensis TaxID=1387779 RepID=A0A7X0VJH2_9BACL|nr:GNAT family N-acetyltransferase [Cohnella nanjingensis]MBB6674709.1 GNAT family N-acetyltransferase [Cohnella nanjingensis]
MQVAIAIWTEADLPLLHLSNAPEMVEHLGGPETEEQVKDRHRRYVALNGRDDGQMFSIVLQPGGEAVGTTGYWENVWQDETICETGWGAFPPYRGRGIAAAAVSAVIARVREAGRHRYLHAFPSTDNPASNAICRKLGFVFLGETAFEYPKGSFMHCNAWRFDLRGEQ